jgi:hypothetical protein
MKLVAAPPRAGGGNGVAESVVIDLVFRSLFRYPGLVNENAARLVAAGVVALVVVYLFSGSWIVLGFLAYGFVARVLTGPTLSPLAQIVNTLLVPRLSIPAKLVPGPPKRFAQGIGAVLSVGAVAAQLGGLDPLAYLLVTAIGVAAILESVFAFCVGCWIFARLMAIGLVPASVCEACNDLSLAGGRDQRRTSRTQGS